MTVRPIAREEFYEAILDDEAFAALVQRFADMLGASSFAVGWKPDADSHALFQASRWSADLMADYERDFSFVDVWNVAALKNWRPNRAMNMIELVSDREFDNSVLYNEFLRPIGDDTFRALSLPVGSRWGKGAVAFHRPRTQPRFETDAVKLLDSYAADLAPLLAVRGKMTAMESRASSIEAMADRIGQAMFLVSGDARLFHANAAADAITGEGQPFRIKDGRLGTADAAADVALKAAVARVAAAAVPLGEALFVPRPRGGRTEVSLLPVASAWSRRRVMVTATDPTLDDHTVERRLRALYALSAAEAELAVALSQGATVAQMAEERRTREGTVRLQLKRLMEKLDCRRQVDVVRIVRSLPLFHNGNGG